MEARQYIQWISGRSCPKNHQTIRGLVAVGDRDYSRSRSRRGQS